MRHTEKTYRAPAVVAPAVRLSTGVSLSPDAFSGGEGGGAADWCLACAKTR